jgi:SAM-dependent methyltransferase
MDPESVWEKFFDGHAPKYMNEPFTKNTAKEVEFILEELKLKPHGSILDVGCGTGRHSVELARRGFRVTGVDISSGMLAEAQKAAQKAAIKVTWIHENATKFKSNTKFDAAICLCEGAFGLLNIAEKPIEHDLSILANINHALKVGAKLILTAPNGFQKIRKYNQEDVRQGKFDPLTTVETCALEWETPSGKQHVTVRERGYIPTELTLLLSQTGFEIENIWGGTAGKWGHRTVDLDEIEVMVVARKSPR